MCTGVRFNDKDGSMYFGRNLDWTESYGQNIVITPRNFKYKSAFLGEITPKNGAIIGMAIVEENTPLYFDCMNEAGLGIAGLNFPGFAQFEKTTVDEKFNVAAYEFPFWITLNFSSVDEVTAALKNTAIIAKPINDKFPVSGLHYLIGDKDRSIVVEYTKNGMEIFENPTDVLTNAPNFEKQLENQTKEDLPGDWSSESRFQRANYLNSHYTEKSGEDDNVLRLFHTLAGVAIIEGAHKKDGKIEKTIYTGGYSTASRTYYFNTYENPTIMHASLDDYDLAASELTQI